MKWLFFLLLLTGCDERKRFAPHPTDLKYCLSECRKFEFHNFHNSGSSWGTGSSSMNGLHQEKILDQVNDGCVEFYKGKECCERNDVNDLGYSFSHYHSWEYGECK